MKKVLFLLIVFVIKLSAYEYLIYQSNQVSSESQTKYIYYLDKNNILTERIIKANGVISDIQSESVFYDSLGYIAQNDYDHYGYIGRNRLKDFYSSDYVFLNDLYTQCTQSFLNFLYNNEIFNNGNHIRYDNFELLYNSDGLAVESLLNGVYAGLYNMDEMQFSGKLYNENGDLVLVNGVEPSYLQMLCDKLIGNLHLKMLDAENLIDKGWIFAVALTFAMFYLIVRILKKSLMGKNNKGVSNES